MTTWIIFWIFWFDRFCCCCFVISASFDDEEIIDCDNSLWSLKTFEWRFFSFCSIVFDISFRVLSDSELFLNDFAKFWEDSNDSVKNSANDSATFLNWSAEWFLLFFRKKIWVVCIFDDKFFDNLNKTRINSFDEFLFLNEISSVVDLIDCDVLDVFVIASTNDDLNCL
jgi:hypothetical protein